MPNFTNDDGDDCMPDTRGHNHKTCKCTLCVEQRNKPPYRLTQQDWDCLVRVFGGDDYDEQFDQDPRQYDEDE